jgi:hypothetical protein
MKIIESLTQFTMELGNFENQLASCSQSLATCGNVRHSVRGRMGDCGTDIVYIGNTFATAHLEVTAWAIDEIEILNQTRDDWELRLEFMHSKQNSLSARREEESRRGLMVAYKSILFFLRAFHDSAYAVLVELTGGRAGAYPSMYACLTKKKNGPASEVVFQIPGYEPWFLKMRDWRNKIKNGAGLALDGPQTNIGVSFMHITDENALEITNDTIHLRDLIESVRFSSQLLTSIVKWIENYTAPNLEEVSVS